MNTMEIISLILSLATIAGFGVGYGSLKNRVLTLEREMRASKERADKNEDEANSRVEQFLSEKEKINTNITMLNVKIDVLQGSIDKLNDLINRIISLED